MGEMLLGGLEGCLEGGELGGEVGVEGGDWLLEGFLGLGEICLWLVV